MPLDDTKKNVKNQEDEEEEQENAIKYAISTRGRFASFMQVRQIQKASFIGNPNRQLMRASQIIDPSLPSKVEKMMVKSMTTELKHVGDKGQANNDQSNTNVQQAQPVQSHSESKEVSNITPYILLIALSFHGFFEGIALGLQESNKEALFLYIAIISHKWAESFTLGISFSKANIEKSTFIKLIILFSIFTPLGAILGLILSNTSKIIEGIFLAMSGGNNR
jgi:zinc transporter ZupT